jgi:signal peptidase I
MNKDLEASELYEAHYRFKERRSAARFFVAIACLFVFFYGLRIYWVNTFGGVQVDGESMCKTLADGDQLLMKYSDGGKDAKRGDVIVVYVGDYSECANVGSGYLIKRLIAIEGDTVKCVDGQVYIQYEGETEYKLLDEPYAHYRSAQDKVTYDFGPYKVGEGEIFFLGDNRNNSVDSRYGIKDGSHLSDRLYKAEDIFGIVPDWAIEHQKILEKIFFH